MKDVEPLLEPLLRWRRFSLGAHFFPKNIPLCVVDVGCGPKISFRQFTQSRHVTIVKYIGIDPLLEHCVVKKWAKEKSVELVKSPLDNCPKQLREVADVVVALALLEHVNDPLSALGAMSEMLRPGGLMVLTTPSTAGKPILEFLCYRLHVVSRREIDEHKNYFDRNSLKRLAKECHLEVVRHSYFILGMNNLLVLKKPKAG